LDRNKLEVTNLRIWDSRSGEVLVPSSSFHVKQGSCLAIVGESGSGKSLTCRAVMRLHGPGIRQAGDIRLSGVNLSELSEQAMRKMRGKHLCMIMQHGMRAFAPSSVVGVHLRETLAEHYGWSRADATAKMKEAMASVMLKDPVAVMNKYPHQLSGGMLQRVMIALALVLEPDVIIADEPTTALDAISQYEVMEQLKQLKARIGCSMILVSHDLGVVHSIADEIMIMQSGEIVESGTRQAIFSQAQHAYTRYLLSAKQALNQHFRTMMGGAGIAER
jgi:nickel transport system ATP-binding protein